MKIENLVGRCLFCDDVALDPYNASPDANRLHNCDKFQEYVATHPEAGAEMPDLCPVVYPFPRDAGTDFVVPPDPRLQHDEDVFAVSAGKRGKRKSKHPPLPLPYGDWPAELRMNHLRCGNATLYDLGKLTKSFGFEPDKVTVLDMSTYAWSNTLKDPRSWAVLRTALYSNIKHLGVWTAGNAGLSLAKMAYTFNRHLKPTERISVHCYYIEGDLPQELVPALRGFEATVTPFSNPERPEGGILTPGEALDALNRVVRPSDAPIAPTDYWDVSDGWDGLAIYMYRLLGRQICYHLKPDYIVVPVGTGDLFYGLYCGRMDCENNGVIGEEQCRIVAAVPEHESILTHYRYYKLPIESQAARAPCEDPPVAPKLATIYTPLLLVMYDALRKENRRVIVQEVSLADQREAADQLVAGVQAFVAAEPSAMIAFAALHTLAQRLVKKSRREDSLRPHKAEADVVVVNSGFGVLGQTERDLLREYLAPVRRG